MEIAVNYIAIDTPITKVIVNNVYPDEQYIMCDLFSEDSLVCHNACYWYDGVNKNIPFNYMPEV